MKKTKRKSNPINVIEIYTTGGCEGIAFILVGSGTATGVEDGPSPPVNALLPSAGTPPACGRPGQRVAHDWPDGSVSSQLISHHHLMGE